MRRTFGHFLSVVVAAVGSIGACATTHAEHAATAPTTQQTIRIAIYADKGALTKCVTETSACLPESAGFKITKLTAEQIRQATSEDLEKFDLLVFPGGLSATQAKMLEEPGRERVREFVKQGGGYLGICAGAYLASVEYPWSLALLNANVIDEVHWLRGRGDVQLKLEHAGQAAFGMDAETCFIHYENGPLLGPGDNKDLAPYEPLASFETEMAAYKNVPKGVMVGTTAIARGQFGEGRVVCFSPHPEKTVGLNVCVQSAARWAARQNLVQPGKSDAAAKDNLAALAAPDANAKPEKLLVAQPAAAAIANGQKAIKVALYADGGAAKTGSPKVLSSLPKESGFDLTLVSAEDIRNGALEKYDVLIQPGGMGSTQAKALQTEGREKIKSFVSGGGGYIGICAGAYLASSHYSWSLGLLDARVVDSEHWNRGTGQVTIKLSPDGMKALGAESEQCSIYYGQGPLLAPGEKDDINDFESLASYETEIAKKKAPSGVMVGTTAIARSTYGKGRVQCFSPHPEKTPGLEPFLQAAVRWAANQN